MFRGGALESNWIMGHYTYQWINPSMSSDLNVLLGFAGWSDDTVSWRHYPKGTISLPSSSLTLHFLATTMWTVFFCQTLHHAPLALELINYKLNSLKALRQINLSSFNRHGYGVFCPATGKVTKTLWVVSVLLIVSFVESFSFLLW